MRIGRSLKPLAVLGVAVAALAVGVGGAGALSINVPNVESHVTRTWSWGIAKSADRPVLKLALYQKVDEHYAVTVGTSGQTDSDPRVTGTMHVVYPDPGVVLTGLDGLLYTGPPASYTLTPLALQGSDCVPPFPGLIVTTVDCMFDIASPAIAPGFVGLNAYGCPAEFFSLPNNCEPDAVVEAKGSSAPFDLGAPTVVTNRDGCVAVTDTLAGNLGSSCSQTAPTTFSYTASIGGYTALGTYQVDNTASFTTSDTGATGSATASVIVDATGCTFSKGYWKNHGGFGSQDDMVSRLLPITLGSPGGAKSLTVTTAALAVQLLDTTGSNGIDKLYAQLAGAKLNNAVGASLDAVAGTVSAADAFLATHNPGDWKSLKKAEQQSVLGWMTTLYSFNEGVTGPGHCSG